MVEVFFLLVIATVLGAFAGGVAALTHQALIAKTIAKAHADLDKLEALKAKL